MDDYYTARGWDVTTGLFTKERLRDLDLEDFVDEFHEKGFVAGMK